MYDSILVIGSTNVDFLIKSDKLPASGETVTGGIFTQNFGGKGANQAVGAARAGGNVSFITCLGEDLYADELLHSFKNDHIDTQYVFKEPNVATGTALILLDKEGNNCISVAPGANFKFTNPHIDKAMDAFIGADMIILQMEIPFEVNKYVFSLAKKYKKKVMFNLAPARSFDLSVLEQTYVFVVNEVEASMVTGLKVESDHEVKTAALALLDKGPEIAVITLGAKGSFFATRENQRFVPAFRVKAVDTTAAGDVYCGSLAVALVEGKSLTEALQFAGAASAISVTRLGAQPSAPSRDEIDTFLKDHLVS